MTKKHEISGTREWSVKSVNCVTGCSHNCRYCYARFNAVNRFSLTDDWTVMRVRDKDVRKRRPLEKGTVMFPTTHDITPEVLEPCLQVLKNLLDAGNHVLIVSKPHVECIKEICSRFSDKRNQILFRFTVGAYDNSILKYWEPGAPSYEERFECLRYAYYAGFKTSISAEPMLDPSNVVAFVDKLENYVTDAIWIGHMNKTDSRVAVETAEDQKMLDDVLRYQTKVKTREIYEKLKDRPKLKWKESVKKLVGLDLPTKPGLDA